MGKLFMGSLSAGRVRVVRQEKDFFGGRCECGKESKDQKQTAHLPGDFAGSVARCSVAWNLIYF